MKNKQLISLCIACFCLLLLTPNARAHKVNIFAYAEGGTVYTESYFPDGRPVENGTINVYNQDGKQLLSGTSDIEGLFSFSPQAHTDLTIEIIASMGHKNSFFLSQAELGDLSTTEPQPQNVQAVSTITETDKENKSSAAPGSETVIILQNQHNDITTELRAIKREIAALSASQGKPGAKDIFSGIGYILGLLGIAFFILKKK